MATLKLNHVRVDWTGPFLPDEALASADAHGVGLYQIYGRHLVFGADSLLYVGATPKGGPVEQRLRSHTSWFGDEQEVEIHVGRIILPAKSGDDCSLIAQVERLTIWYHAPPYNSAHIQNHGVTSPLFVQNVGNHRALLPEYSNAWDKLRQGQRPPMDLTP